MVSGGGLWHSPVSLWCRLSYLVSGLCRVLKKMAALQKEMGESLRTECRAVEPDTVTLHPGETGRYDHRDEGIYVCQWERGQRKDTQRKGPGRSLFVIRTFIFYLLIIKFINVVYIVFWAHQVNDSPGDWSCIRPWCSEVCRPSSISGSHACSLFPLLRLHFWAEWVSVLVWSGSSTVQMNSLRSPPPAKRLQRAAGGGSRRRRSECDERKNTREWVSGTWAGEGSEETRRAIKMIKGTGRATVWRVWVTRLSESSRRSSHGPSEFSGFPATNGRSAPDLFFVISIISQKCWNPGTQMGATGIQTLPLQTEASGVMQP